MASSADSTPPPGKLATFTATDAKNSFGAVLDRALIDGPVAISKHDEVRAVLLSVQQYEALRAHRTDPLDALTAEFETLLQAMQTDRARDAGRALFDADGDDLGSAAVASAEQRKRR